MMRFSCLNFETMAVRAGERSSCLDHVDEPFTTMIQWDWPFPSAHRCWHQKRMEQNREHFHRKKEPLIQRIWSWSGTSRPGRWRLSPVISVPPPRAEQRFLGKGRLFHMFSVPLHHSSTPTVNFCSVWGERTGCCSLFCPHSSEKKIKKRKRRMALSEHSERERERLENVIIVKTQKWLSTFRETSEERQQLEMKELSDREGRGNENQEMARLRKTAKPMPSPAPSM